MNPFSRLSARDLLALALLVSAYVAVVPSAVAQTASGKPTSVANATAETNLSAESVRLFMQMHTVLGHPRCVNCHPRDDTPKQGIDQHVHSPPITRGANGFGPPGLSCAACHTDANFDPGRVPGAPGWHLAPASMAWEGKSAGDLCRAMTDRSKNGNRDLQATVRHLTDDKLVAWGWAPGIDVYGNPRQPVPLPKAEFNRVVVAWAKSGGVCPP